jgi:hypothetical protein
MTINTRVPTMRVMATATATAVMGRIMVVTIMADTADMTNMADMVDTVDMAVTRAARMTVAIEPRRDSC